MLEDLSFLPELPTIALFASLLHIFYRYAYLTMETCSCSFSDVLTLLRLLSFDICVAVHHDKFLIMKPTRCTDFSDLFLEWNSTCFTQFPCPSSGVFHCTHSNGICHTLLLTACEQDQDVPSWSCFQLSANLYNIYHCCMYSEKLLMMDRGTVRNM
jgi:hypothetical protein